jgi:predicted dienelactone hydrolase
MTAIAWAIILYAIITDQNLKDAPSNAQNFAFGLCVVSFIIIISLTIKDFLK